jgi:hypothetical protein
MFLKKGLLFFTALALLAFVGQASAGPNANAVVGVDIDASDNKMNDGNTSGTAVAGTDVVVEIFVTGLAGPIVGGVVTFDTDKLTVKSAAPAAGFFALGTTANTVSFGAVPSGTLTNDYFGTVTLSPVEGLMASTEFTVGVSIMNLAGAANPTDTDNITTAMMAPLSFNAVPRLDASATTVPVPPGGTGTGTATVTAVNFPADATITFDVQGMMMDNVMHAQDGATLTLTASGPATATVTASDGMTSAEATIKFVEMRIPALDAVVGMDMMNMMDDGTVSATAGANEEIAIEVFAGDVDGGLGGASIVFVVDPASAAMITGFDPAEGLTLLGISGNGNQIDIGAEEAVMLSNGGFVGTLKLMTGAEEIPFTVGVASFRAVLGSGEETMLLIPEPVLYNHSPDLDVSPGLIATIPRGGTVNVTVTPVRFAEGATVTFTVEQLSGVGDDPQSTIEWSEANGVLTITAAGYVSTVVKVTATDGTSTVEKTIQFTEQVAVELSSFVGALVEDRVVINWVTASQTNNAGFRVLRSTDGETYEVVSELIAGAGTTDQLMDYIFEDTSLPAAEIVYYILEQIDLDGTINRSNPIEVLLGARFILPTEFASAVYPNPFNPRTTISYDLPADTNVSVIIYDAIGQEIRHLVSQHYTAGRYSVQWDAKDFMGRSVGSGVYIAKIKAGPNTALQKMLLLK